MENILAVMRNNFCENKRIENKKIYDVPVMRNRSCQKNIVIKNKKDDVLAQMRSSFCDKSKLGSVKKSGKRSENYDNHTKKAEILELLVNVKEEPVSDDENENEETIAIGHENANCLEEKESNQYIQQIKQEKKNGDEHDAVYTNSDFVCTRTNNTTEALRDIIKEEEIVVDWTDDQIEENNARFEVYQHFLKSENVVHKQNEDDAGEEECEINEDIDENKEYDSDYIVEVDEENECNDSVDASNIEKTGRKGMDIVNEQLEMTIFTERKADHLEKWCCKFYGKACFLCFNDERYQTEESLLQHIRESHCDVKLVGYRLKPEYCQEKVKKVFYLVDSSHQDGFGLCIDCYMVFYSAEKVTTHMIDHVKSHYINMPKFHTFRSCCREDTAVCVQPTIVCGECRCHLRRSEWSLRRHGSLHHKVNGLMNVGKGLLSRMSLFKHYSGPNLCVSALNDSKDSYDDKILASFLANNTLVKYEKYGIENNIIDTIDSGNGVVYTGKDDVKSKDIKKVLSANVNNILSEMQQKFCNDKYNRDNSLSSEYHNEESLTRKNVTSSSTSSLTTELGKNVTIHSPKVVIERVEWDCKSAEQKMQFIKYDEIRHKNQNSKKRKIDETVKDRYLIKKSYYKDICSTSNKDIIVEVETSNSKLQEIELHTIMLKDDYKETYIENGSSKEYGSSKQLNKKSGDHYLFQEYFDWHRLSKESKKRFVAQREWCGLFLHTTAKVNIIEKYMSGTPFIHVCQQAGVSYLCAKFWIERVIKAASEWLHKDQENKDIINISTDSSNLLEETFKCLWKTLTFDQKKRLVSSTEAGSLYLDEQSRIRLIDKYMSGCTILALSQQTGCIYNTVKHWFQRIMWAISKISHPDQISNKKAITESFRRVRKLRTKFKNKKKPHTKFKNKKIFDKNCQLGSISCREPKRKKGTVLKEDTKDVVPDHWRRKVVMRTSGLSAGKFDVYYFSPDGKKLRSSNEVQNYCQEQGLEIDLSLFKFRRINRNIPGWLPSTSKTSKTP